MKFLTLIILFYPLSIFSQSSGKSILDGKFIAPAGITVVIQKDGADDLTLVAGSSNGDLYTTTSFKFPKSYTTGTPYTAAVKSVPAGFTCRIEKGARGTVGLSPGFMRVGADYTYDLLSRSTDNKKFGTFYECQSPVLGGAFQEEGRYVAFMSGAAGLDNSSGKHRQIYWRDRKTGITKMISRASTGEEGNGDSFSPSLAADGKSVAFESYATNLSSGDNNMVRDIFKWNAEDNQVILVSSSGTPSNGESYGATLSGDGTIVAFCSGADNLTAGVEGNSMINVYVKDLSAGSIQLLTKDPRTGKAVGGSSPSISDNGSRVAFCSFAASLVEDDKNGLWDIFIYDNASLALKRVSMGWGGSERQQGTESASRIVAPALSGNGAYVSYASTAPNIVPDDTNGVQDVFVVNIDDLSTVRISVGKDGTEANGDSPIGQGEKIDLSFDGSLASFTTKATNLGVPAGNIVLYNRSTGEILPVTTEAGQLAGRPALSRNGGYIAFGIGARLDGRFMSSGLFAKFTALTRCFACSE